MIVGGTHGTLALARRLGAQKARVSYVTQDLTIPSWSRFIHETVRWSGPHDGEALAFLLDAAQQRGWEGRLLIAGGDAEIRLVSEHFEELSAVYKVILPDWNALRWVCEKPLLYKRATELGVRTPLTYESVPVEQTTALKMTFPVVLKPNMGGGNNQFTKAKVVRADDPESFMLAYRDAAAQIGTANVVIQELIPGEGDTQFSYAALWSNGEPLAEFTVCRRRQYPLDFGYTSTCVDVVDEPRVVETARVMLKSISFRGLVEVEFKLDKRDNSLKLLDINPRPWSWFGLCSATGVDLGTMLWQVANGRPVQPAIARQEVSWMYLFRDFAAAVKLMARGHLDLMEYLRSLGRVRSWAAFAINDPLPGLIDLPLTAWRVLTRRVLGIR